MLARTRLKLKNAESSISFMQEQHARTLEDLHKEIEKLQKKNARLTFELTMSGGKSDSGKLMLEEDLISEIARLQSSLSKEQENGALLQHQVESLLTRHSEEIAARDDSIKQLNNELEVKANIIALVTQQLYQARTKLKQEIEARPVPTSACTCPHCHVHRKTSPSGTDNRLSPLREKGSVSLAEADTDSSTASETTPTGEGKWLVPTPPISPRPPPLVSRNHSIKKRASTPIRRQSPTLSNSIPADLYSDNTHLKSQWALRPARTTKDPGSISTELQQLLSQKDSKVARRESHPILPPIPSSSHENQTYHHTNTAGVTLETSPSSQYTCAIQSTSSSVSSPHSSHRRLVLAKSKGLSSAPSTLRVLRYRPPRPRGELEEVAGGKGSGGVEELEEEEEGSEGTLLMVKETDPKGNVGPAAAQWDTCT